MVVAIKGRLLPAVLVILVGLATYLYTTMGGAFTRQALVEQYIAGVREQSSRKIARLVAPTHSADSEINTLLRSFENCQLLTYAVQQGEHSINAQPIAFVTWHQKCYGQTVERSDSLFLTRYWGRWFIILGRSANAEEF